VPPSRTPTDHRGTMTVSINRGDFDNGQVKIEKLADTKLPREDRWLGQ
jgi:branched-chain amino acid transport system substrate-binding protein